MCDTGHLCNFPEDELVTGRRVLGPCLVCGRPAIDDINFLRGRVREQADEIARLKSLEWLEVPKDAVALVLRKDKWNFVDQVGALMDALKEKTDGVFLIYLDPGQGVESVSESDMNLAGWVRKEPAHTECPCCMGNGRGGVDGERCEACDGTGFVPE